MIPNDTRNTELLSEKVFGWMHCVREFDKAVPLLGQHEKAMYDHSGGVEKLLKLGAMWDLLDEAQESMAPRAKTVVEHRSDVGLQAPRSELRGHVRKLEASGEEAPNAKQRPRVPGGSAGSAGELAGEPRSEGESALAISDAGVAVSDAGGGSARASGSGGARTRRARCGCRKVVWPCCADVRRSDEERTTARAVCHSR